MGLVTNPDQQGRRRHLINARAETVESRPTFAEAFAECRCVIPVSGFYEWTGPSKARQPFWIHRRDGDLLLFAGLYQDREKKDPGYSVSVHDSDLCSELNARHDTRSNARHLIRSGRR
jgi:putative SOS response-associated peptidase YedK